jgi:hypothetical protein
VPTVVTGEVSRDGRSLPDVTTRRRRRSARDCPLCSGAVPYDEAAGAVECDACGARLEVAPEPEVVLPVAA